MRWLVKVGALSLALGLAASARAVESASDQPPPRTSAGKAVDRVAQAGSDAWITAKVKAKIMDDSLAKRGVIHVDVKNQVVTLTGSAPSSAAREHAVYLARDTQGVRQVVDQLSISPAP
jgi:osmotically-inducible protein OsmY